MALDLIWQPELDERERQARDLARQLTADHFEPLAADLDAEQRYPWESVKRLVESGLVGAFVPGEYGGQDLSLVGMCAVMEEIAQGCASTCAILNAIALGSYPLLLEGTAEQKKRYLTELTGPGNALAFALTERGAGSDASSLTTVAEPVNDGFHLRGEKIFIGNGGAARYYIVFARTSPAGTRGISAFIVDREAPGVDITRYEDKMGIRGTLTSNLVLDTVVPKDALVGELNRGYRLALRTLNVGRITVAAQCTGIAAAAYREAAGRATTREQFGTLLIDHQGIGFRLADALMELSAARLLMYQAAQVFDRGGDASLLGAKAKLYASEVSHRVVDTAVQVFGGLGYCKPTAVERYYRDQRITEIYEGTSEIQRLVLARAIKSSVERSHVAEDAARVTVTVP